MLSDVRNYYGLAKDFEQAGHFGTEHSEQIVSELKIKKRQRQLAPGRNQELQSELPAAGILL